MLRMKVNFVIFFNITFMQLMNIKGKPLIEKNQILTYDLPPKGFVSNFYRKLFLSITIHICII